MAKAPKTGSKKAGSKQAKSKAPPKKPKAAKPQVDKPAPRAASKNHPLDPQEKALFHHHLPKVEAQRKKVATAVSDLRTLYKTAKADGFAKSDFDFAIEMRDAEKEKRAQAAIARQLVIARFMDAKLGDQLDLFLEDARIPATDKAYEQGQSDSMKGVTAKPSYAPESPQHQAYMKGYHDDQESRIKGGIKKKAEDAGDGRPKGSSPPKQPKVETRAASKALAGVPPAEEPVEIPPPASGVPLSRSAYLAQQAQEQATRAAAEPETIADGDDQPDNSGEEEPSMFEKRAG